jgi:hypothetical protein
MTSAKEARSLAPLTDAIITAVGRLVDDYQSPREPSHDSISTLFRRAGLMGADPAERVGKRKRVRAVLSYAIEHDETAGRKLVGYLIAELRGCGGFRDTSPNYVGPPAAPTATRSLYVETASTDVMKSAGTKQAQSKYLAASENRVILHFGQPFYGTITPGNCFSVSTPGSDPHNGFHEDDDCHVSFSTMEQLVKAYISGYVGALQQRGVVVPLRIAVGPNNSHLSTVGSKEPGLNLTYHAQLLADRIEDLNAYIQHKNWTSYVSVRATCDCEPGFDPYGANYAVQYLADYDSRVTAHGYGGATSYWWDGGSADGCNQTTNPNGTLKCGQNYVGNWYQDTIIQLSWTGPAFSGVYPYPYAYGFPQIYSAANAQQWANISYTAATTTQYGSGPVAPFGPLTTDPYLSVTTAWNDLYTDLWNYTSTRSAAGQMVSTTRIYHGGTG